MSDDSFRVRSTLGAATKALHTHDILYHLFEVDKSISHRTSGLSDADLLRCALVSRAFCEPALGALWTDMSEPMPLWLLLAPISMESPEKPSSHFFGTVYSQIMSEKTYTDRDRWARFKWYARFTKEFSITNSDMEREHKQLIHTLVAHNDGEPIFPALQSLWWPMSSYSDTSFFPLLTSRLHSMVFDFYQGTKTKGFSSDEDPVNDIFLAGLRTSSPRLGQLSVCSSRRSFGMNHSRIIASFEHLTDLHLVARISLASFRKLAAMPRMESLRATYILPEETEPSRPSPRIPAPHLALLSVGGSCPLLTQLLIALEAPILESATLQVICDYPRNIDDPIDYPSCIEALATIGSPSTMEDLCISLDEDDVGPQPREHLGDLIAPLIVFHNLTRFSLSCPAIRLVGSHGCFLTIASAWPKLKTFKLWRAYWTPRVDPDDEYSEPIPLPTPRVLAYFCDHCPALEELVLPYLDFDADVPFPSRFERRVPVDPPRQGLALTCLSFGAKCVAGEHDEYWDRELDGRGGSIDGTGKAAEWARYVLELFPNLDAAECLSDCYSVSAEEGWIGVFNLIGGLQD